MNNLKEYNGLRYYTLEDGTLGIFSIIDKNAIECVIPSEIDGIPVSTITNNAFSDCNKLQSCTIPEGIVHISYNAFEKCYNLKSIEFPESLTHIGDRAFNYCSSIIQVVIPKNVTYVGTGAFDNCNHLRHVLIENPACYYEYAFTVYPNALLEKKNIKIENVINNIFYFKYSESEFTKFALMRNDNSIQIQHVAGSIPHVYDIMRALKIVPEYIQNIPERKYRFTIQANFSERGRGYYRLLYFKNAVSIQKQKRNRNRDHGHDITGVYTVGCEIAINSTGKVEDCLDKDFYINDLLEILYTALGDFNGNKVTSYKTYTMKMYSPIVRNITQSILDFDLDEE